MENVVLVIHLILALGLIGVVLLQRSEGGGLGIGGGGGGGVMSARGAATALSKITWGLAIAFLATSIALTVIPAWSDKDASLLDDAGVAPAAVDAPAPGADLDLDSLLPPATGDDTLAPPRVD